MSARSRARRRAQREQDRSAALVSVRPIVAIDLGPAEVSRDLAIDHVEANAALDWMKRAIRTIKDVSQSQERFTSDDLWTRIEHPREPKALGAALRAAWREGYCEPTNMVQRSARAVCHTRSIRVWRSKLKGEER